LYVPKENLIFFYFIIIDRMAAKRASIPSLDEQLNDINLGFEPDILLRKRHIWHSDDDSLTSADIDLLDDDIVEEEEDEAGCPLPSTPEDNQLLEAEVC
jgi:adiponectin receptor